MVEVYMRVRPCGTSTVDFLVLQLHDDKCLDEINFLIRTINPVFAIVSYLGHYTSVHGWKYAERYEWKFGRISRY